MDSHTWYVIARAIHIVSGAFWLGAAVTAAVFLLPSVRAAGPSGGAVMHQVAQVRRFPVVLQWTSIIALLSGAYLYWRMSGGFSWGFMASGTGLVLGLGGLLALIAAVIGSGVSAPAAARMNALGAAMRERQGPPDPDQLAEMARLQARLLFGAQAIAALLLVAIAAMAVGRYV